MAASTCAFRRLQLAPGLNDIGLRLVANLFDVEPLLSLAFLVQADG